MLIGPTDRSKRSRQNDDPLAAAAAAPDENLQALKTARVSDAAAANGAAAAAAVGNAGPAAGQHQHQQPQLAYKPGDCIVQVTSFPSSCLIK